MDIEFQSFFPYIVDAFCHVYGEEYRSIIFSQIHKVCIVSYQDAEGLHDYIHYLKGCKARQYAISFLEEIGVDVQKYKKSNYTEDLDSEIEEVIEYYMDSTYLGFSKEADEWAPLRAFKKNNTADPEKLLDNKIILINYLLGREHDPITEENFEAFTKTEEYSELLKKN